MGAPVPPKYSIGLAPLDVTAVVPHAHFHDDTKTTERRSVIVQLSPVSGKPGEIQDCPHAPFRSRELWPYTICKVPLHIHPSVVYFDIELHGLSSGKEMPVYEYVCRDCRKKFELVIAISRHGSMRAACPKCKSKKVDRRWSTIHVNTRHYGNLTRIYQADVSVSP